MQSRSQPTLGRYRPQPTPSQPGNLKRLGERNHQTQYLPCMSQQDQPRRGSLADRPTGSPPRDPLGRCQMCEDQQGRGRLRDQQSPEDPSRPDTCQKRVHQIRQERPHANRPGRVQSGGSEIVSRIFRSQHWQSDWRQSMVDSHPDGLVPNGSDILATFLNVFISWITCYQLLQHYFPSLSYTLSRSVSSAASLAHPRKERVKRSCEIGASPEGLRVLIWIIAVGISSFDNLPLLVRLLTVIYASTYVSRMPRKTVNHFEETEEHVATVINSEEAAEIDSDVIPVTASDPAEAIDSDAMTVGDLDARSVVDRRLQRRSCVAYDHRAEPVLKLRTEECEPSCDSEWCKILAAMANGPDGPHLFLVLWFLLFWLPLVELSAAATLVILSGLVLWFDGTAFNFIRLGVESRVYPSRLATPQWTNRKSFQRVISISSRRRSFRSLMPGKGKNLRGQFPWEVASEPSQTAPKPRQQEKAVRVEAAAPDQQAAAVSNAKANEIWSTDETIYDGMDESTRSKFIESWQLIFPLIGGPLSQIRGSRKQQATPTLCTYSEDDEEHNDEVPTDGSADVLTAGASCDADNTERTFVWQWDSMISWRKCNQSVPCHALGPGNPARQGARHE